MKGSLTLRMFFIIGILFGIIFLIATLISPENIYYNLVIASIILLIQYLLSPYIVQFTMGVKYVSEEEEPELHAIVEELALNARIPKPKVAISNLPFANAFAFGRGIRDGRVCVTRQLLNLLTKDELKAVIGHEIGHIKNRDMAITTLISIIPMILYNLYRFSIYGAYSGRRDRNSSGTAGLAIIFLILYFISNLLILAISRIREYFADYFSVKLGNPPENLASALYKIVYGSAKLSSQNIEAVAGFKAFFLNDINSARNEIKSLSQLDINKDFTIDAFELQNLKESKIKISLDQKIMEIFTTHPNILKRIKKLSEYT